MSPNFDADNGRKENTDLTCLVIFCIVFAVQLLLTLAFGYWNGSEEYEYYTVARNMLEGKGFVYREMGTDYRAFLFPVFPLLRFVLLHLFGDATWPVQLLLIGFNAGSACLAYRLTAKLTARRTARFLAAAMVALHPGLVFYAAGKVHWLPIAVFLSFALMLLVYRLFKSPSRNVAVTFGLCLGFAYLLRSSLVMIGSAAALAALPQGKFFREGRWKYFLIAAFCAMLAASPWWIRNRVVLGNWKIGSTAAGMVFWKGNNPEATGTNYRADGEPLQWHLPRKAFGKSELEQNEIYKREAMAYIAREPAAFVTRTGKKLFYFLWFTPDVGKTYSLWQTRIYQAYYVFVLLGVMLYLFRVRQQSIDVQLVTATIILFLLITGLLHALVYVENRHRWLCEGLLLCLAAGGYAGLMENYLPASLAGWHKQRTTT